MTYALSYDVPGDEKVYEQVKAGIGEDGAKGLLVHLVLRTETGLHHMGVWESEEDWKRFQDERVRPAVHAVLAAAGFAEMPPDPTIHELALVDLTFGD